MDKLIIQRQRTLARDPGRHDRRTHSQHHMFCVEMSELSQIIQEPRRQMVVVNFCEPESINKYNNNNNNNYNNILFY